MKTYIIGHQKPDTDSVVAALALEHLYKTVECFGYKESNPEAVIIDPPNPETSYLFDRFKLTPPRLITAKDIKPVDRVVLVDHNEESQRLSGLNPDQIVEIVDHHKINLNLQSPIYLTFKPWGSSASIVYHLLQTNKVKIDKTLAALLLSAILSDTVGFKSATTTDLDQKFGLELAKLAGIKDLEAFTLDIFKAKSNVGQLTPDEIVTNDYKIFDFAQKTFINQIETVEQDTILHQKSKLLKAMAKVKSKQKVDLVFCAVTDILKVNTKLLLLSESEAKVATQAFGGRVGESVIDIGPKLSRKKEIAPAIEKALT